MEKQIIKNVKGELALQEILEINKKTEKFGLSLSWTDALLLMRERINCLREKGRVEFGRGVLPDLIEAFCSSAYIYQENYVETIIKLQEIFYLYKNESMNLLTDKELITFMSEAFDNECQGSLDYLEDTVLEKFARKIRENPEVFFGVDYNLPNQEEE